MRFKDARQHTRKAKLLARKEAREQRLKERKECLSYHKE